MAGSNFAATQGTRPKGRYPSRDSPSTQPSAMQLTCAQARDVVDRTNADKTLAALKHLC